MKDNPLLLYERKEKSRYRTAQTGRNTAANGFICTHCHGFVYTESGLSGVQNRNHCPYCLWSRHLDLYAAGDRLSACKSLMQPIGLTIKFTRKKYGPTRGELMLIHSCKECNRLSINRIAADDDPQMVFTVFEDSFCLSLSRRARLDTDKIFVLDAADRDMVHVQLFGQEAGLAAMLFHSRVSEKV
jgi:hypothetical protein